MEVESLEQLYERMQTLKGCRSIAKKHLTPSIVSKYKDMRTRAGGTLALCLNTNAYNAGAHLPRSTDIDCYTVFNEYFDAVIRDYHKITSGPIDHPPDAFGDLENLPFCHLDPANKYVVSTRVRVGRTVKGYEFAPLITKENRLRLEESISEALKGLGGEHEGVYYPLTGMKKNVQKQLIEDHFLFRDDEPVLRDAGGYRDWPSGRGIFHNNDKTFLVWVNEEDHIRIISMQMGGDLPKVYKRLINGIRQMEKKLDFAREQKLGYLTSCPSNLGTTMKISIHMRIPFLSEMPNFKAICKNLSLQARKIGGEHEASVDGLYEISNQRCFGLTEVQVATELFQGVTELIRQEGILEQCNTMEELQAGLMPVEPLEVLADMIWNNEENTSYTKKHLTREIVEKYKNTKSSRGSTLAHIIRIGVYQSRSRVPRMGDPESYDVFVDYVDALMKDYHQLTEISHPPENFGSLESLPFGDLDPSGKFILSTRVRVGRSVQGFSFPPTMKTQQRLKLEETINGALKSLDGQHAGKYHPLVDMDHEVIEQLINDHFLFKYDDPYLRDAGGCRDWPIGRGIFFNESKTFLVWVCEEDHLRMISMQQGGNLGEVYTRLAEGVSKMQSKLQFVRHPKYGFLNFCPSNVGTTMRASVHIKVPKLAADKNVLNSVCEKYNLQIRGFHGVFTENTDETPEEIYDLSNKRRLGFTEIEAATEMAVGIREIIKLESSM